MDYRPINNYRRMKLSITLNGAAVRYWNCSSLTARFKKTQRFLDNFLNNCDKTFRWLNSFKKFKEHFWSQSLERTKKKLKESYFFWRIWAQNLDIWSDYSIKTEHVNFSASFLALFFWGRGFSFIHFVFKEFQNIHFQYNWISKISTSYHKRRYHKEKVNTK